ncbi:hypothetical protein EON82_01375 [bacterium]|nr:MAG: hypothetical protein EON82_01375 [bacterium]
MTQTRIEELERVRKEIGYWRGGAFGIVALAVVASAGLLYSDAHGLVAQGPTQDRFVAKLREGLNEQVVPRVKDIAGNALSEMQPIVQAEFAKLNERVPDVTEASLKQLDELQESLPKRCEKVVQETLGKAIEDGEPEIRAAFNDIDEASMTRLVENLTRMATTRSSHIGEALLAPHMESMKRIHNNLGRIAASEPSAKGEALDDWQMGLAVFDVLRSDIEETKQTGKKVAHNDKPEDKA